MRGDLGQSSLADLMRQLYAERRSGILHVLNEGIERRVHFKKGVAVFADSAELPLGSREQAARLLDSLFCWTSGEYLFEESEPTIDEARAFVASPSAVILEGCRGIDDRRTLEHLTGGPDSVFVCTETSVLPLFTMKLLPEESTILKFARERGRFVSRDLPLAPDDLTVIRALNSLVSVGLLDIAEKGVVSAMAPTSDPAPAEPPAPATASTAPPPAQTPAPAPAPQVKPPAVARPTPAASSSVSPGSGSTSRSKPRPAAPTPRRSPRLILVSCIAVLAVAAVLATWLSSRRDGAPPDPVVAADPLSPQPETETAPETAPESRSEPSTTELTIGTDRELSVQQPVQVPPRPPAKVANKAPTPGTAPEPEPPTAPIPLGPSSLLAEARTALERGELDNAKKKLDELEQRATSYPGADELRAEVEERVWGRKLPLTLAVRHDHALGGCNGVLTLTTTGFAYRSKEHEWVWSFGEVAETERRDPKRLRIETRAHESFNFQLKENLSDEDWTRHRALAGR